MIPTNNLHNFYRTKQASFMDYLKSMGIGAGIGGGAGAGLGAWGGHQFSKPWEELGVTEEILELADKRIRGTGSPQPGGSLVGTEGPQAALNALVSAAIDETAARINNHNSLSAQQYADSQEEFDEAKVIGKTMIDNPKTLGGIMGGLGGAALGAGGGLAYQGIKDLLFSGGKESQVKRNLQNLFIKQAVSEEELMQIIAALSEAEAGKKKKKTGPNYGKRFGRGALAGGLYGGTLGTVLGAGAGLGDDPDLPNVNPLVSAGIGGVGGAAVGAVGGGLSNMLQAYLQGDLYDAVGK